MCESALKKEKLKVFEQIANLIENNRGYIVSCLRNIEPQETAIDEVDKTVKALRTYQSELKFIKNRKSIGDVAVSLPFNNPLYSFVLYCFGPCLGGSVIHVRPSKITSETLLEITKIFNDELLQLNINLVSKSGAVFIYNAHEDLNIQTLLFTGSWGNLKRLETTFPKHKKLIYCGSGVNPFIVSEDALDYLSMESIVELAISSRIYNSGQDCLCSERFYIHETIADEFIEELKTMISRIIVSDINNDKAEVIPLLGIGADITFELFNKCKGEWHVPFRKKNNLIYPSLIEVPLSDDLLQVEKYAPVFVMARYQTVEDLDIELDSEYLFGATVCGGYNSKILDTYPHLTNTQTVISSEAEDSHIPFGGKRRSGFVRQAGITKDGPILFSIETTN